MNHLIQSSFWHFEGGRPPDWGGRPENQTTEPLAMARG
jgi:hypothetical protein